MAFRNSFLLLLLFSFFSFTACKKSDDGASSGSSCPVSSKIIIGNNDWVLLSNVGIDAQTSNGRAVAQIKIPRISASCTGFLINSDTVMTNNHCVSGSADAAGVTATFRYENQTKETFACDQFVMTDMGYDFTLLKCKNSPGTKYGWVGLSNSKPTVNTDLYVIQENCDYTRDIYCQIDKYIAYGDVLESQSYQISHNADTLPGSSGSPVFSTASNQVIALHNAGGNVNGQPTNFAVPMNMIRNKIGSNANVYSSGSYNGSSPAPDNSGGSTTPPASDTGGTTAVTGSGSTETANSGGC